MKVWPSIPDPSPDVTQQVTVLGAMKQVIEMVTGQRTGAPAPVARLYKTHTMPGFAGSPIPIQQLKDGDIWINKDTKIQSYWDVGTQSWITLLAPTTATGILSGRNRLINSAFGVNQYSPSGPITSPVDQQYVIDRWQVRVPSTGSIAQTTQGLSYLFLTNGAAQTPAAADLRIFLQKIEGNNVRDLGWGFSGAAPVTLSFRVYCSLTGLFGGCIRNGGGTRSYPFTFNIPVANTWTNISLTIPGDTTGTWATDSTSGMELYFDLGVGSTYRGTPGAWAGANYVGATGAVNWCGTAGATIYFSNVQLEAGSVATPFEWRDFNSELIRCKRYFEKVVPYLVVPAQGVTAQAILSGVAFTSGALRITTPFKVEKRATPTITTYRGSYAGTVAGQWNYFNGSAWVAGTGLSVSGVDASGFTTDVNGTYTAGSSYLVDGNWTAAAEL